MIDLPTPAHPLVLACSAYVLATASPGPSNMAIMATAMHSGRRAALVLAAGVVTGSCFWGLMAALGLATLLATYGAALNVLKLLGGAYLLWLAFKSARASLHASASGESAEKPASESAWHGYRRGLLLHLTNPKAIFAWLAIVALALPVGAPAGSALAVVAACIGLGMLVFGSYAIAFSTSTARRVWRATHRGLNATLALVFGYAGLKMIGLHGTD